MIWDRNQQVLVNGKWVSLERAKIMGHPFIGERERPLWPLLEPQWKDQIAKTDADESISSSPKSIWQRIAQYFSKNKRLKDENKKLRVELEELKCRMAELKGYR